MTRTTVEGGSPGRLHFAAALVLGAVFLTNSGASPCDTDADCDDGVDCNGIETCGYDGECRAGIGLCGPLPKLVGSEVSASSSYGVNYPPAQAFDGINELTSSWCTAGSDAAPTIALAWALDVQVSEIRVRTSWSPAYDFLTARFRLLDASGDTVFDSGSVALTDGEVTVPIVPEAVGVRRVEMVGETWRSNTPCLSEIEINGTLPCATDADCEFVSPCIGVGICLPSGSCSATAPRCRNLSFSHADLSASSTYSPTYPPEHAVDGIDTAARSWCSAGNDSAPTFSLTLPNDHPVDVIAITNPWNGFDFQSARFTIEDAQGAPMFDSGPTELENGEIDLIVVPPATAAHRVTMEGLTFQSGPCVGEFEVLGEYCAIALSEAGVPSIHFRPGTPTPEFELRYGLLSDLRADGGFDRAVCLGRYASAAVTSTLPDPAPGEGYYVIGRGFNVCVDERFGMSRATPDPRAELATTPSCPP